MEPNLSKKDDIIFSKQKAGDGMKVHKALAWMTVLCFVLTIITGYKKQ